MPSSRPHLYIIAGPNGAGKTTFATKFLPEYAHCDEFINADLIARGISPFAPEKAALGAGKLLLQRIRSLSAARIDFGFETTLSGKAYVPLLKSLKTEGYALHLFFLWLKSMDLACRRVQDRMVKGGHYIPRNVIRRRYKAGLANFFDLYEPLLDTWMILNNSGKNPELIAKKSLSIEILDDVIYDRFLSGKRKPT
ncbi:MAG: zeta toxin family protein [Fibrobacterota bacterium]